MKLNWTVLLTIPLLLMMVGAGITSAMWGFSLGREALKGVTQPDFRPTGNISSRSGNSRPTGNVDFVAEEDILKQVNAQIDSGSSEVVGDEL
jgi:hypothetical protein